MTAVDVRVSPGWLALREPADAAARSRRLAVEAAQALPASGVRVVHDLGCGSGSMLRWLAPLLSGPQHWVLHDRDQDLLGLALTQVPERSADGAPVTAEVRRGDLTRLAPEELAGASLVTASALLDMLTGEELDRVVHSCVAARCPVLLTLTVLGQVRLTPADPLDAELEGAFNDHQRRTVGGRTLLGPDAGPAAIGLLSHLGARVVVERSPWRLGPSSASLLSEWLAGWVAPAVEQRPGLRDRADAWLARRRDELRGGTLTATVEHVDVLALPGVPTGEPGGEPGGRATREAAGAGGPAPRRPAARPEVSVHG